MIQGRSQQLHRTSYAQVSAAAVMHQGSADSEALCCRLYAALWRVSTWELNGRVLMASRAVWLLMHSLRLQQTCVWLNSFLLVQRWACIVLRGRQKSAV